MKWHDTQATNMKKYMDFVVLSLYIENVKEAVYSHVTKWTRVQTDFFYDGYLFLFGAIVALTKYNISKALKIYLLVAVKILYKQKLCF